MPLREDDLRFRLKLVPDTAPAIREIAKIGAAVDKVYAKGTGPVAKGPVQRGAPPPVVPRGPKLPLPPVSPPPPLSPVPGLGPAFSHGNTVTPKERVLARLTGTETATAIGKQEGDRPETPPDGGIFGKPPRVQDTSVADKLGIRRPQPPFQKKELPVIPGLGEAFSRPTTRQSGSTVADKLGIRTQKETTKVLIPRFGPAFTQPVVGKTGVRTQKKEEAAKTPPPRQGPLGPAFTQTPVKQVVPTVADKLGIRKPETPPPSQVPPPLPVQLELDPLQKSIDTLDTDIKLLGREFKSKELSETFARLQEEWKKTPPPKLRDDATRAAYQMRLGEIENQKRSDFNIKTESEYRRLFGNTKEEKERQSEKNTQKAGQQGDMIKNLIAGVGGGKGGKMDIGALASGMGVKGGLQGLAGMAGPYGALIAAAPEIARAAGELAATPFNRIVGGLQAVSSGLRGLQGQLGPIGLMFDAIEGSWKKSTSHLTNLPIVGELLEPIVNALPNALGQVRDILSSLTSMSSLASPALFEQWQIALEDTQAVIGRAFLPVLDMMRQGVRLVGDAFATILPNFSEMQSVLAPLIGAWNELKTSLYDMLEEIGPMIRTGLVIALRLASDALTVVVRGINQFVRGLHMLLRPLMDFLGLAQLSSGGLRSSVGAAARPAQISGLDQYREQLQLAAFTMPATDAGKELQPMEQAVAYLHDIYDLLGRWYNTANQIAETPGQVANTDAARVAMTPFNPGDTIRLFAERIAQEWGWF